MTDILVVNHGLHQVCGVHDLGWRLYDAIPDNVHKGYVERTSAASLIEATDEYEPAVVLVNWRADLMPWVPEALPLIPATTVAVAHNYEPHTLGGLAAHHRAAGFDMTLALEPRLADLDGVVWSGRPMPPPLRLDWPEGKPPMIGSFGFAFGHKRFDLVADQVAALGPDATFRLHAPTAHFGGSPEQTDAVVESVRARLGESKLIVTTDHRPSHEVVSILAGCDVNCLLYDPGQPDAGLSSALDYLLAAGRPILVSEASMFRHARPAAVTFPEHSVADVLENADRHAVNVRERYDQLTAGYAAGIRQLLEWA